MKKTIFVIVIFTLLISSVVGYKLFPLQEIEKTELANIVNSQSTNLPNVGATEEGAAPSSVEIYDSRKGDIDASELAEEKIVHLNDKAKLLDKELTNLIGEFDQIRMDREQRKEMETEIRSKLKEYNEVALPLALKALKIDRENQAE